MGEMPYRLGGILLAQLSLLVDDTVVVVGAVRLALLGSELVGDRTLILGVKVLVAGLNALGVALTLGDLGLGRVALVTSLVEGGVANVGLSGRGRHVEKVCDEVLRG